MRVISTVNRIVIEVDNEVSGMYTTLGGRAECVQCSATSKRTKKRCGNPAVKDNKVCRHHGGKSTSARTEYYNRR